MTNTVKAKQKSTAIVETMYWRISGTSRSGTRDDRLRELYKALFGKSPIGIYIVQNGKFQYVNDKFQQLSGYSEDELLDTDSLGYVHPEDRNMVRENAVEMLNGEHPAEYEYRVLAKGGETKWIVETVASIQYRGRRATLGYFMDITERKRAEEALKETAEKRLEMMGATIAAMAMTIGIRDPYTAGHQRRVTELACAIAREMGLSEDQTEGIRMAGIVHDIGKMYVPADILSKTGQLSEIEFSVIKMHPRAGYVILKSIDFPWPIAQTVLQHHERLDGSGYPSGLSGEKIILEARILAVADVVEAMASHRPYRPAFSIDMALDEISQNRGVLYDPEVVDACLRLFTEKGLQLSDS